VLALWESAGPGIHVGRSDTLDEILKKLERDPELFLVAEREGKIIGAVMGGFDGRRGMVYHLAVTREHRQQGIGSALLKELERRLRRLGCLRCYLLVPHENTQVEPFYEARGWERMPVAIFGKDLDR
jgi:ribosomal protein S18 acetylase RimI-like enzyme